MSDTILIVDDEESVRRTFQEWLALLGARGARPRRRGCRNGPASRQRAPGRPRDPRLEPRIGQRRTAPARRPRRVPAGCGRDPRHRVRAPGHAARCTAHGRPRLPRQERGPQPRDVPPRGAAATRAHPPGQTAARVEPNSLAAFREAVERILPIVQTAAAFNDPVPLTEAVKSLLRFVIRVTGATDGALIVRHASPRRDRIHRGLRCDRGSRCRP